MKLTYFLYASIPGAPDSWTVAILATGRSDANQYCRAVWKGGKFVRQVDGGKVNANCGSITDAAAEVIHQKVMSECGW